MDSLFKKVERVGEPTENEKVNLGKSTGREGSEMLEEYFTKWNGHTTGEPWRRFSWVHRQL